jgi:hypothetical protein
MMQKLFAIKENYNESENPLISTARSISGTRDKSVRKAKIETVSSSKLTWDLQLSPQRGYTKTPGKTSRTPTP